MRTSLMRRPGVPEQSDQIYGTSFPTVHNYSGAIRNEAEIVDLEVVESSLRRKGTAR